ncbi:MAG: tetracycline resistance from transposon [Lasallia pustulata]|uniref:Tetracycline resistance from transposon n=1 Tax=Lasallia pustulata TaxID=136370 RepID=A0A5M8Q2F1_9LECA|nr:MAG: tetracycline resistance from transposon [Lasallia pustulata]
MVCDILGGEPVLPWSAINPPKNKKTLPISSPSNTSHNHAQPLIAIIGSGLAGVTLARFLHLGFIPVTVFEREPTPTSGTQGGSLDLHTEMGLRALREAGL